MRKYYKCDSCVESCIYATTDNVFNPYGSLREECGEWQEITKEEFLEEIEK